MKTSIFKTLFLGSLVLASATGSTMAFAHEGEEHDHQTHQGLGNPNAPLPQVPGGPSQTQPPTEIRMTEKRMKFFMSNPGFTGMISAVARVNKAMRVAAENPMDEWRRIDVRNAIAAMPAAITGLAQEYMKGALHDGDFPVMQSMLGGFVDVSAADAYQKFLIKPDAALIPKLGPDFPGGDGGAGGAMSMQDSGPSSGEALSGPSEMSSPDPVKTSGELVDLGTDLGALTREVSQTTTQGTNTLGMNDSAPKPNSVQELLAGAQATQSATENSSLLQQAVASSDLAKAIIGGADSMLLQLSREIASLEGKAGASKKDKKCKERKQGDDEGEECEPADDDFFKVKKGKIDTSVSLDRKVTEKRADKKNFTLNAKPKFWRAMAHWQTLLVPEEANALSQDEICAQCIETVLQQNASRQPPGPQATQLAVDQCIQMQQCSPQQIANAQAGGGAGSNGGGGGNSGGGGGGGGQGAAAAGAIAGSLAAAASTAAMAAIAADADKHAASEAARAAVTQTQAMADATVAVSNTGVEMNGNLTSTAKFLYNNREQAEMERERKSLAFAQAGNNLARSEARKDRALEQRKYDGQFKLMAYAMRGQFALQNYALQAQSYLNQISGGTASPINTSSLNTGVLGSPGVLFGAQRGGGSFGARSAFFGVRAPTLNGVMTRRLGKMFRGRVATAEHAATRPAASENLILRGAATSSHGKSSGKNNVVYSFRERSFAPSLRP